MCSFKLSGRRLPTISELPEDQRRGPKTLRKMPKASSLTLSLSNLEKAEIENGLASPTSRIGHKTTGGSFGMKSSLRNTKTVERTSPTATEVSQGISPPASPKPSKHRFYYSSARRNKSQTSETRTRRLPSMSSKSNLETQATLLRPYRTSPGSSTASLSMGNLVDTASMASGSVYNGSNGIDAAEAPGIGSFSYGAPRAGAESAFQQQNRHAKSTLQGLLSRSRSGRRGTSSSRNLSKIQTHGPVLQTDLNHHYNSPIDESPRTAPLQVERSYRQMMSLSQGSAAARNKSAERTAEGLTTSSSAEDATPEQPQKLPPSREGRLLTNIMTTSSKAAEGFGRAGRGFFNKWTRPSVSAEREPAAPEKFVPTVINLPLAEQTRRTRIRSRMEDAKDKTEFWMPALPYRCIDFLNMKGVEEEGLYRVPGSEVQVKHWQKRFDTELDINLLDEPDLYDINTIGSMLKAWLRGLPDEILPKEVQNKVARECPNARETPQLLKDELSKLPPFNYYLLFAVTCHIALLHANSEKNKMNFHNLCICFQPCMKIDGYCFQFLVCDWYNCWRQKCWTETEYLAEEYKLMEAPAPIASVPTRRNTASSVSLASGSRSSSIAGRINRPPTADRDKKRPTPLAISDIGDEEGADHDTSSESAAERQARRHSTPPALSPVAAVSPMRM